MQETPSSPEQHTPPASAATAEPGAPVQAAVTSVDAPAVEARVPLEVAAQAPADAALDAAAEAPAEAPTEAPVEASAAALAAAAAPAIPDLSPPACAALLAQHFPALFGAGRMLPIKLRIQADIQLRVPGVFNKKSLSIFLHRHTTSTAYIKALLNSPHRFDLDGQAAGDIAQEHRDAGKLELERRLAIVQERRLAQRQAERDAHRQAQQAQWPTQSQAQAQPQAAPQGDGPAAPGASDLPAQPRPPRPPRPQRPQQAQQPARAERMPRPPRPEPQGRRDDHAAALPRLPDQPRPPRPPRPDVQPPQQRQQPVQAAAPALPLTPEQAAENEARRCRAALLRSFESSTISRANFCALKGMKDAALETQLVLAREERKLNPPPLQERPQERPQDRQSAPQGAAWQDRPPRQDRPDRHGRPGRPPR